MASKLLLGFLQAFFFLWWGDLQDVGFNAALKPHQQMLKVSLNSCTFPAVQCIADPFNSANKKIVEVQLYGNLHKGMYSIFALRGQGRNAVKLSSSFPACYSKGLILLVLNTCQNPETSSRTQSCSAPSRIRAFGLSSRLAGMDPARCWEPPGSTR